MKERTILRCFLLLALRTTQPCFLCLFKTTVPLQISRYGRPNGRNYVQRTHKALRRLPVMVKVAAKFRVDKLIQVSKALLYLFQVNRLRISGQLVFTLSGFHGKPIYGPANWQVWARVLSQPYNTHCYPNCPLGLSIIRQKISETGAIKIRTTKSS